MDTRICVSISDWLVSYAPCDWSYSCEMYYAMLKIDIVVAAFQKIEKPMSDSSVYCIYAVASAKRETEECYSQRDGNNSTYSLRLKVWNYVCDRSN